MAPCAMFYFDDLVIFSKELTRKIKGMNTILEQISHTGISLKLEKRSFACTDVQLLGHLVSTDGIIVDPEKNEAISEAPIPCFRTKLRSILGLAWYYWPFIKEFSKIAAPLHEATSPRCR